VSNLHKCPHCGLAVRPETKCHYVIEKGMSADGPDIECPHCGRYGFWSNWEIANSPKGWGG